MNVAVFMCILVLRVVGSIACRAWRHKEHCTYQSNPFTPLLLAHVMLHLLLRYLSYVLNLQFSVSRERFKGYCMRPVMRLALSVDMFVCDTSLYVHVAVFWFLNYAVIG